MASLGPFIPYAVLSLGIIGWLARVVVSKDAQIRDQAQAMLDLNKETLKGTDRIRPNMKLRLPAKPLAAAM